MNLQQNAHLSKTNPKKTNPLAGEGKFPYKNNIQLRNQKSCVREEIQVEETQVGFQRKIYDRVVGYTDWHIPHGTHCIIGSLKQIMYLARYLISSSKSYIEALSAAEFLQTTPSFSFIKHTRLVLIDVSKASPEFIGRVISNCINVFVHRPENLYVYCQSTGRYRVSVYTRAISSGIMRGIGMEQTSFLDVFCGVSKKEFLEISTETGERWVRSLDG